MILMLWNKAGESFKAKIDDNSKLLSFSVNVPFISSVDSIPDIQNEYHIIFSCGVEAWVKNGVWHNENGPAWVHPDGRKEWWINGVYSPFS